MHYYELSLQVSPDYAEILVAELAEIGYDSFIETPDGLEAYITDELFEEMEVKQLLEKYADVGQITYSIQKIEKKNWNEEWEKSFSPIEVDGKIYVRATFHPEAPAHFAHEIIITPKMSFGTGHHETTSQVLALQLDIPHQNKKVLDVGTGTGILAILAAKLGATEIHSFDIDEWSVENTKENIELNDTHQITVELGTIQDQTVKPYDIVLANINRNILLAEIPVYVQFMELNAYLIVSGFYVHDVEDITQKAAEVGLKIITQTSKNNWSAIVFQR